MTENPNKSLDGQPDLEGVQGFGYESCLANCRCNFFINSQQRVRLHSVVTSLRKNSLAEVDNDKCKDTGLLPDDQDDEAITSKCKTSRKRTATQMTSSAVRKFFDFVLNKRKTKKRKRPEPKQSTEVMDHSTETSCDISVCSAVSKCDTASTESVAPQTPESMLLNLDSQTSATQMPFATAGMPSVMSFAGGNQQALLFLVGSQGVPVAGDLGGGNLGSCPPFGNAVFVAQPVTLNLVPQDVTAVGGVIEKAMELANVGTSSVGAVQEQPQQSSSPLLASQSEFMAQTSQCSLQSVASKSTLAVSSFNNVPQVSQDIVMTPSASGENITIDNVSQSVTVQTSPVSQNQGGNKPSFLQVVNTQVSDSRPDFSPPKMIYKRKGASYREVVTQTGGEPEVVIVSEVRENYQEKLSLEQTPPNGEIQSTNAKKPGSEKVRRFACDICEKKFYTNHDLRRHRTIHQDSRPFICEVCNKTFRTHSELKLHSAIHNEGTPYKCEFCGKEFRTKGCIKSHIKYHIGDKRHKCTECGRAFVKSADLKRHMAGHRNEKKYVCDDCGSAFTRRDNLKAHSLLHSRESVVTCDLCSKEFINAVYLKRHMHIHKQAKKKPYECQWCPKTYEQLEGLRRHIRQHVGDEKFVCKHCAKKFITSIQLKRHLWLSHEQDSPYRRSIL